MSILIQAIVSKQFSLVKRLLSKASITDLHEQDVAGRTALHLATLALRIDIIELLLQRGANIEQSDDWGYTPLHYGVHAGCAAVVKCLLTWGAYTQAKSHDRMTPIHIAKHMKHTDLALLLEQSYRASFSMSAETHQRNQLMRFKILEMQNSTKERCQLTQNLHHSQSKNNVIPLSNLNSTAQ